MALNYYINQKGEIPNTALSLTDGGALERASRFHKTIPGYAPTPLVSLDHLAQKLGVAQVLVKDESRRFGLNAFKALGGSYAMACCLGQRLGWPEEKITFEALMKPEVREKLRELTFVTATDGNHGRGVAWAARQLGHKSVVYMPKGSARERLDNIRAQGAQAEITDLNYDDAVRLANQIPAWIMEGYTTIAWELFQQLEDLGGRMPTHLFLQAGVGSFAGAILGSFAARLGKDCPITCIVEPDRADCLYRSARAADGKLHPVTGEMNSMMAGLCCGEPCTISWEIIRPGAAAFLSCSDEYSAMGMRLLGRPEPGDPAVVSGESGAVGVGVLSAILHEEKLEDLRWSLGLNESSRVLCISTEGDTDQANYQKIVGERV